MMIGDRLRTLREQYDLTQEELAARVGVKQATISHVETGLRLPTLALAIKLAGVLHVTVDELVSGEKSPELTS